MDFILEFIKEFLKNLFVLLIVFVLVLSIVFGPFFILINFLDQETSFVVSMFLGALIIGSGFYTFIDMIS